MGQGVLAGLPHPSGQLDPGEKETRISHGHGGLTGPVHLEVQNDPGNTWRRQRGLSIVLGAPSPRCENRTAQGGAWGTEPFIARREPWSVVTQAGGERRVARPHRRDVNH